MNKRQHKLLARALIDANGGVDACCSPVTRVERSALYAYRDFGSDLFMPADVIDALESRCGNPVYSQFLFEAAGGPSVSDPADATAEAEDVHIAGYELWRAVKQRAADGQLSEGDRRALEPLLIRVEQEMREVRAAIEGAPT